MLAGRTGQLRAVSGLIWFAWIDTNPDPHAPHEGYDTSPREPPPKFERPIIWAMYGLRARHS
jgi:hypothetical protein